MYKSFGPRICHDEPEALHVVCLKTLFLSFWSLLRISGILDVLSVHEEGFVKPLQSRTLAEPCGSQTRSETKNAIGPQR